MQMMALTKYERLAANANRTTCIASRRPAGKQAQYSKPQNRLSYVYSSNITSRKMNYCLF